jgi:hypothetical protein
MVMVLCGERIVAAAGGGGGGGGRLCLRDGLQRPGPHFIFLCLRRVCTTGLKCGDSGKFGKYESVRMDGVRSRGVSLSGNGVSGGYSSIGSYGSFGSFGSFGCILYIIAYKKYLLLQINCYAQ